MALVQKNNFSKGVTFDLDQLRVPQDVAVWIKDCTLGTNLNADAAAKSGENALVRTPSEGNKALSTGSYPGGNNYCIGIYNSEQTNELYYFLYNSSNNHSIWVINGDDGSVSKVYQSALLAFQLDPQYFISEGRCTLELRSIIDPVTGLETNYKFLIFTTNLVNQFFIEVGSSIATNSFSTTYFTSSSAFYNTLELVHLGVPTPLKAIGLNTPTAYTPTATDPTKQNALVRNGWQFRIKFIDVFGRESEHGIISEQYVTLIGGGCLPTSNGLPRCLMLNFDAGNPLVNQIQVEYRQWIGNERTGSLPTNWYVYEVFNKYDNNAAVQWYSRSYNPIFTIAGSGITFNAGTNTIAYTFCADKNSIPIDTAETERTQPGVPRISGGVFSINKRIGVANNVHGFQPLAQSTIDKVVFSAKLPDVTSLPCPAAPLRTITVYAAIYKPVDRERGIIRQSYSKVVWGNVDGDCGSYSSYSLDQVFADQTDGNSGFIGCIRGTNYKCIATQGDFDPATGTFTETGYGSGISFPHGAVQQFVFKDIPAGKYIIQVASHKTTIADADAQKTSTYVGGLSPISDLPSPSGLLSYASTPIKEIVVDCSAGDVKLSAPSDKLFVILDLGINSTGGSAAIDGYLYEQNGKDTPIEMNPVYFKGKSASGTLRDTFGSFFTDHNGFYFGSSPADTLEAYIYSDFCLGGGATAKTIYSPANKAQGFIKSGGGGIVHGVGGADGACKGVHGSWDNKVYLFPSTAPYPEDARRLINQKVFTCSDHTIGVPGIPIAMTKGAFGMTNSSGLVSLIAHNRYDYSASIGSNPLPWLAGAVPNYSTSPNNQDLLIISQKGGCEWNACGGCNTYTSDVTISYLGCGASASGCSTTGVIASSSLVFGGSGYAIGDTFTIDGGSPLATGVVKSIGPAGVVTLYSIVVLGAGYIASGHASTTATSGSGTGLQLSITVTPLPRTLCAADIYVTPNGVGLKGVQSGGKYPVAFILHDVIGRHTDPQIRQGDAGFVYTPNLNDLNAPYPTFALSQLQVNIDPTFLVDPIFTKMTFLVGANLLFSNFFSWSADWVQPIDNTGATNTANPTAIRIYYGSLNEYNKSLKSNAGLQINTDQGNADVIQFITNGDSTFLPSVISAPITYNDNAQLFFTIDYLPELAKLTNGCLFRVIRPVNNQSGENIPLYEQNLTIDLVNGVPTGLNFTLPYTDSYLLSRSIPVPILKGQGGPISPGSSPTVPIKYTSTNQDANLESGGYSTSNVNNNNGVVIFDVVDYPTTFPFFFESPSPSDFYCSHLASWGRIMYRNPFEMQQRIGTEIALSAALGDRGTFNGLSYFESQNAQVFDRNTWGNITAVLVETSVILVICDRDHFVSRYDGANVHLDANGNLVGQNQYGIFTTPERKSGTNYGCNPEQINTIAKYAGIVHWLDVSGYLVSHNFSAAKSDSDEMGYQGYLLNKIANTNIRNLNKGTNGLTYPHGSIDSKDMSYVLTWFNIPISGAPSYLNQLNEVSLNVNEAMVFDHYSFMLKNSASYTAEMGAPFPSFFLQKNYVTFKQGKPYLHHYTLAGGNTPPPYANYYGTQCLPRVTFVTNVDPDRVKRYFYMEVYVKENIPVAGSFPTSLFLADVVSTEAKQASRILTPLWKIVDNYSTAYFICDLNTPADPNIPVQTGTNVARDGNPLIGRWMKCSLVVQAGYSGTYFELSGVGVYVNEIQQPNQK